MYKTILINLPITSDIIMWLTIGLLLIEGSTILKGLRDRRPWLISDLITICTGLSFTFELFVRPTEMMEFWVYIIPPLIGAYIANRQHSWSTKATLAERQREKASAEHDPPKTWEKVLLWSIHVILLCEVVHIMYYIAQGKWRQWEVIGLALLVAILNVLRHQITLNFQERSE